MLSIDFVFFVGTDAFGSVFFWWFFLVLEFFSDFNVESVTVDYFAFFIFFFIDSLYSLKIFFFEDLVYFLETFQVAIDGQLTPFFGVEEIEVERKTGWGLAGRGLTEFSWQFCEGADRLFKFNFVELRVVG